MLSEVGGSCTYDNMIKMFEAKMSGGPNDPDDLIVDAFKAYDEEVEEKIKGVMVKRHIIDAENFRHILTVFGDKLNEEEEEKKEEAKEAAPSADDGGQKKKKKKKKAA